MKPCLVAVVCGAAFLVFLVLERIVLDARLRRIPVRIAVAGTRGKSSVARLIAAALREDGKTVLAKTTGSRPVMIYPDGSEREIRRRGRPTILEQKKLVRLGARLGADVLVAEMMSIRRECLFAESRRILRPQVVVVTNVRLDHLDLMGRTLEETASCLSAAFPVKGTVVLSEKESFPVFDRTAAALGSEIVFVEKDDSGSEGCAVGLSYEEFETNIRIARATVRLMGVDAAVARTGMTRVKPDFGSLRTWTASGGSLPPGMIFINAFAANDPESTLQAVVRSGLGREWKDRFAVGLLNLRDDRGDRSLQWMDAIEAGAFERFHRIAVIGKPAGAFCLTMRRRSIAAADKIVILREVAPEGIIKALSGLLPGKSVVVGMGNIMGIGQDIVSFWETKGIPYVG